MMWGAAGKKNDNTLCWLDLSYSPAQLGARNALRRPRRLSGPTRPGVWDCIGPRRWRAAAPTPYQLGPDAAGGGGVRFAELGRC